MSTADSHQVVHATGHSTGHDGHDGHRALAHRGATHKPVQAVQPATMNVLVYSDDVSTRERIRVAVGRRPVADLPAIEYVECATPRAVVTTVDRGGIDVVILDGEAVPAGGMGVCRQLKDEIYNCPPVLLIIGRADDGWLATWSRADAVISHPIDPIALAHELAGLMRERPAVTS